jgi:hypothetical protein
MDSPIGHPKIRLASEEAAVVEAGAAWMMTVLVEVEVRPALSVAT